LGQIHYPALVLGTQDPGASQFAIADLPEIVLMDEDCTVLLAADGRQALKRLTEGPIPDQISSSPIS